MSILAIIVRLCVAVIFLAIGGFTIFMTFSEGSGEGLSMIITVINLITYGIIHWLFPDLGTEIENFLTPFTLVPIIMVIVESSFEWTHLPAIVSALIELVFAAAMSGFFSFNTVAEWMATLGTAGSFLFIPVLLLILPFLMIGFYFR